MATFDGHIVEALMKMPEVNATYPELKLHAIGWVKRIVFLVLNGLEIQAEMRIWKNVAKVFRETGKYTSVVDLARARANQQYTENSTEKSARSLLPFIANTSRHGKHWMTNQPTLSGR